MTVRVEGKAKSTTPTPMSFGSVFLERHNAQKPAPELQPDGSCCACSKDFAEFDSYELRLCLTATTHGHLPCLQKALQNGYMCQVLFYAAARRGSLDCIQFLTEQWRDARQTEPCTCNCAIWGGHVHCLQYLLDHGHKMHRKMCASAAAAGQLDCLQYLRGRGCPWDCVTSVRAARAGEVDCLQYSIEHGCPWWTGQIDVFDPKCLMFVKCNAPCAIESLVSHRSFVRYQKLITRRLMALRILRSQDVPVGLTCCILVEADLWYDPKVATGTASS